MSEPVARRVPTLRSRHRLGRRGHLSRRSSVLNSAASTYGVLGSAPQAADSGSVCHDPESTASGHWRNFCQTPSLSSAADEGAVVAVDLDELVEHRTLLDDERELIAGKRGPTRLGFAVLLKFYVWAGRFPRGRAELDDEAVAFVARQVRVPASDLGFYEWAGSTIEYHRAQFRRHLGFRQCTADDAVKLTGWLADGVCQAERRADRVREKLLARCRAERIESPIGGPL